MKTIVVPAFANFRVAVMELSRNLTFSISTVELLCAVISTPLDIVCCNVKVLFSNTLSVRFNVPDWM